MTRLDEINAKLPRVEIKGKEYIQVNARVLAFKELYPDGRIETQLIGDDGNRCTFKATVYDKDKPLATGYAFEDRNSFINKTSYIENCETSSVGRALAFCGIGSVESIASADEVQGAINQQENTQSKQSHKSSEEDKAKKRLFDKCKEYAEVLGLDIKDVHKKVTNHPNYEQTKQFYDDMYNVLNIQIQNHKEFEQEGK